VLTQLREQYVTPLFTLRAGRKGYDVSVRKEMMNQIGLAAGPVRPPLPQLRPQEITTVKQMLEKW
jgi:dihydrodipicolinate synthase/N-acetylneuraminate lyase